MDLPGRIWWAISYQLSAISYQLSAISYQLQIGHRCDVVEPLIGKLSDQHGWVGELIADS